MSELSIYSPLANLITAWLVISAIMSLTGFGKALYTATVVRRTDPRMRKHITQRDRYRMVLIGLAMTVPSIYTFVRFGVYDVGQVCDLLIKADPMFGWSVTIGAVLAFFYVPVAVLCAFWILIKPSPFAFRKGNMYRPTEYARTGNPTTVPWIRGSATNTNPGYGHTDMNKAFEYDY